MSKVNDFPSQALTNLLSNMNLSKGVLAINGAAAATIKSTNAYSYTNNGVLLAKAALAAQSIVPTHTNHGKALLGAYVQPISTTAYYTLALDGAGNVAVVQGWYAGQNLSQLQVGVSAVGDGAVPDVPLGYTPIGVLKVATGGAATFTPGTTALDAAGVTVTYFDVALMPAGLL